MSKRVQLVTMGELLIDFTPVYSNNSPAFMQNPGGAPANVLAMFQKLGGSAGFIGMVGKDMFGRYLRTVLREAGIDDRGLKETRDAETTLAFVSISKDGERDFAFYRRPGADTLLRWTDVDQSLIADCDIFGFGTLSQTADPARSATIAAVQLARSLGKRIAFDPNWRPSLWQDREAGISVMREGIQYADIVKLSEEEAELITGISDLEKAAEILSGQGPRAIFITLGANGCYYRVNGHCGCHPGFSVNVVDTTGAGDAFFGAALFMMQKITSIDTLSASEAEHIACVANAAGALCATKHGAIPAMPSREAIEFLIGRQ